MGPTISRIRAILLLVPFCVAMTAGASGASQLAVTTELSAGDVRVEDGRVAVDAGDHYLLQDAGLPPLPYRIVRVLLPQGQAFDAYQTRMSTPVVLQDRFDPAIALPNLSTEGDQGGASGLADWSSDHTRFPADPVTYLGTGYFHGYAIASFAVFETRIENGTLVHSETVTIDIDTRPSGDTGVVYRERNRPELDASINSTLDKLVVNPRERANYTFARRVATRDERGFAPSTYPSLEGSDVDYIIVTDDSLVSTYQRLADWKTAKGVPTVVRSIEWIEANTRNGVDLQETIRNFVIDAYAKWGIQYLLLGGDTDILPPRLGGTLYQGEKTVPVDMYFGCLDGDWNADHDEKFGEPGPTGDNPDLYQEVYTGRLPGSTIETANLLIDKIISYETPVNSDYTNRVLMLAEVLFPINWTYPDPITIDGAALNENTYVLGLDGPDFETTRLYENYYAYPGSQDESALAALDSIDSGMNLVNHIGHGFRFNMSVGSGNILNADADTLTNQDRYTNIFMLNCTALAYTYFCLGEHFLLNPQGGAVSTIGANESAFPLTSQFYMYEFFDLLINDGVTNIGKTFADSRLPRTPIAEVADNADAWTHYIYSILADPEMTLWTASVEPMTVTHDSTTGIGGSSLTVNVSDSGGAVQGALVCLSKGDEDYQTGLTDASGDVTLNFIAETPGDITVVATAQNLARYEGTITATASGVSHVSYAGLTVDDDSTGSSAGNGDGVIDAGETVEITVDVTNGGDLATGNITLVLRSLGAQVTIGDSTASVGVLSAGQTLAAGDPFVVTFNAGISDEETRDFELVIKDGGVEVRTDVFTKEVHAPDIDFVVTRIDDSEFGNGDGIIDNNEDYRLFYQIKNFGTGATTALTAQLADLDGGAVFTDSSDGYPELASFEAAENDTGFVMREPDASVENNVRLTIIDQYGRTWQKAFELRVPDAPVISKVDPSFGPDRLQLTWTASTAPDVICYRTYVSTVSGGPYSLKSADPVKHTLFMSAGLLPTTKYYFVVTSVDISGNESPPSAEMEGSTNPAQVSGWPIRLPDETVSSPVVGDIDGDQDFEIVQGNFHVYAWHHNGVEMIDKDLSAQTYGLLSELGSSYVSSIALAELDTIPGYDIIAGSRDTQEIYVFDYKGDPLPGWPVAIEHPIRAGMVAGDINNDGQKEVIAIDEASVLYVLNGDGTEYRDGDNNPATLGVFARLPGGIYHYTAPAIADLDMDGLNEIIVGTQGDTVYVFNEDGTNVPGWPIGYTSPISGSIAVGDIDNDGGGDLEMVICEQAGPIYAVHHDGTLLWTRWHKNNLAFGPSPALADLDNDGTLETVLPAANKNLYVIKSNGSDLAGWPIAYSDLYWTESSPVIADLDNDGILDIVLGDEGHLINAWNASGNPLAGFPVAIDDALRSVPTIADVDKDGDSDLIVTGWDQYVRVFDFPEMHNPLMTPWASYHGNLYNDGNIDTKLPTGVTSVAFSFDVLPAGVALAFGVHDHGGQLFNVDRARAATATDAPEPFLRIATAARADLDGLLTVVDHTAHQGEHYIYRLTPVDNPADPFETPRIYIPVKVASVGQNYPNPFNPTTTIAYFVPDGAAVQTNLVIYDVTGRRVRTLVDDVVSGGRHIAVWDGRNDTGDRVSTGVYFYLFESAGYRATKKMLLLK